MKHEYVVEEVKGSRVKMRRGDEVKSQTKNRVKIVKERPQEWKIERGRGRKGRKN